MYLTEGFYWDFNDETRAWSKRFFELHKTHADDGAGRGLLVDHALSESGEGGRHRRGTGR